MHEHRFHLCFTKKWRAAGEAVVDHTAERIDVCSLIEPFSHDLFGTHVSRGAHGFAGFGEMIFLIFFFVTMKQLRQPKSRIFT